MATLAPMTRKQPALMDRPALTNLGAPPVAPAPIQAPYLPPSPQAPPITFTPPTIGPAPTATPTGTFTAPDPTQLSAAGQFRLNQGMQARQRSAAARGTLLSGGFQQALERYAQGVASDEYGNDYNRALATYGANRDTNQQNFGQNLASYTAGTGAALDAGRLGLAGTTAVYDRAYGAQRDATQDTREDARTQSNVLNANQQAQDIYAQMMEDYRAQLDAQRAADVRRQNEDTTRMTGTLAPRRPLPGAARLHLG